MSEIVNLADILGIPQGSGLRREAERTVKFEVRPESLTISEACDDWFGVDLDVGQLAHLIYFLQRRLGEISHHADLKSVPITHLSGCCGWPASVTTNVIDDVTWTTRRCGRCNTHLSTFADAGELDLGVIDQKGNP